MGQGVKAFFQIQTGIQAGSGHQGAGCIVS